MCCQTVAWHAPRWVFHHVWPTFRFQAGALLPVGRKKAEDRRRSSRPSKKSPRINFLAATSAPDLSALNNCASDSEQLLCQIFAKCGGRWVAGSELRIAPCAHQLAPLPTIPVPQCAHYALEGPPTHPGTKSRRASRIDFPVKMFSPAQCNQCNVHSPTFTPFLKRSPAEAQRDF